MARTHRVSYVDLYGRGRSDRPAHLAEVTFAGDVADIAELIRTLDLGPVHVYGFSYGGLLGQALALEHPGLLRSLIIANSLHSPEMWQANHANINAELARQDPDVWERITALRSAGRTSTDPEVAAEFAGAVPAAAAAVHRVRPADPAGVPGARRLLFPRGGTRGGLRAGPRVHRSVTARSRASTSGLGGWSSSGERLTSA